LAISAEQQRKRCMLTASDWPSRVSENGHLVQLSEASLNSIVYQSSKVKHESDHKKRPVTEQLFESVDRYIIPRIQRQSSDSRNTEITISK